MAKESESFLRRWARLKAERTKPETPAPLPDTLPEPAAAIAGSESAATPPEELPSIDDLTKDSDFTPFLKAGVPETLKRLALRKLWRTDPVFANLDGLVEYGEDFAAPFRNPGPVATLFRLGRGMPGPGESEAGETEDAAQPDAVERVEGETPENLPATEAAEAASKETPTAQPGTARDDPAKTV